jgi:hypothetical protein
MICRLLPCFPDMTLVTEDLSRPCKKGYKNSFHMYFSVTFKSNAKGCMADWVKLLLWPCLSEDADMLCGGDPIIDLGVYSKNRALRMPGSSKYAEAGRRPLPVLPSKEFAYSIRMGDHLGPPDVTSVEVTGLLARRIPQTVGRGRPRKRLRKRGVATPARGLEREIQDMLRAHGDEHTIVSFNGTRYRGDTDSEHGRKCLVGGEQKGKDNCFFTIGGACLVRCHCFDEVAHARCASVEIGRIGAGGLPGSCADSGRRWLGELPPRLDLMNSKHTKRLVMSNPAGVASLAKTVRRIWDPWIRRFFPLLVTEWLPVERRFMVGGRSSRGEGCKLCGAARDSVRHILACRSPTVRNEVLACRERAVALLRSAVCW